MDDLPVGRVAFGPPVSVRLRDAALKITHSRYRELEQRNELLRDVVRDLVDVVDGIEYATGGLPLDLQEIRQRAKALTDKPPEMSIAMETST